MKLFMMLLGLMIVVEGIPFFAFPTHMKSAIRKILELPDSQIRMAGLIAISFGLAITYLFKV